MTDDRRDLAPPVVELPREAGEDECERLRAEVARLKADIERLRKHSEFLGGSASLCEHDIPEGEYCPDCNAARKLARIENGLEGGGS